MVALCLFVYDAAADNRGRQMSDEDEIWAEGNEPAEPDDLYDADLVDVLDHSKSYGSEVIEASNDGEAIGKARQWAAMFLKISNKKALLILTGAASVAAITK
jgi:hypothetical protein